MDSNKNQAHLNNCGWLESILPLKMNLKHDKMQNMNFYFIIILCSARYFGSENILALPESIEIQKITLQTYFLNYSRSR